MSGLHRRTPGGSCVEALSHDTKVYYSVCAPRDLGRLLKEANERGAYLIPTRLVASVTHAIQSVVLAKRAWMKGFSRARNPALEALLYAYAASLENPSEKVIRVSLKEVAEKGPRERETIVLIAFRQEDCVELLRFCVETGKPTWLNIPEHLALTRTAVAAAEVERKRVCTREQLKS